MCSSDNTSLGLCFGALYSSCSPNAVLHFDGKHAVVRALENINKGTEVQLNYPGTLSWSKSAACNGIFKKINLIKSGGRKLNKAIKGILVPNSSWRAGDNQLCGVSSKHSCSAPGSKGSVLL
jgi:hypothetical protein